MHSAPPLQFCHLHLLLPPPPPLGIGNPARGDQRQLQGKCREMPVLPFRLASGALTEQQRVETLAFPPNLVPQVGMDFD